MSIEDCEAAARDLTNDELWASPGGVAPVGFHLRHLAGSTDRLLTYARGFDLLIKRAEEYAADLEQWMFDEDLGGGIGTAGLCLGPGPGGQQVPAGAAGGLGIGGDHLNARSHQIGPVADLPGVSLPHEEHDGRGVGRRVVGQA